jgi:hypothetical protein
MDGLSFNDKGGGPEKINRKNGGARRRRGSRGR